LNHALITFGEGNYYIEDFSIKQGTYLNNQRLIEPTKLEPRDVIGICGINLVFTGAQLLYTPYLPNIEIQCQELSSSIRVATGIRRTLDNVNFSVGAGELVYIIGESRTVKSTLLNVMSGFSLSEGWVLLNGVNLERHFGQLESLIGYVPHKNSVYRKLKLFDMLYYEAKLRLPIDYSEEEYEKRIHACIGMVELDRYEQTIVEKLSGGQLRRASIAVELLSDPVLLFMDEPSSGLDPGSEKNLMITLKKMAQAGKTIFVTTHPTLNVSLADQLVVMGSGGRLCYYGEVLRAISFFRVDTVADIYNQIGRDSAKWQAKYNNAIIPVAVDEDDEGDEPEKPAQPPGSAYAFKQLRVLISRYLKLLRSAKLVGFMVQVPVIGALLMMVFLKRDMYGELITFTYQSTTKSLLFALTCSGFCIGIINAITEVSSEVDLFLRERVAGLQTSAYVGSKVIVLSLICLIQTVVIIGIIAVTVGFPEGSASLIFSPPIGFFITFYLISLSSMCLGLAISSISPSTSIAMCVALAILLGQIFLSGIVIKLSSFAEVFSALFSCKWGVKAFLTLSAVNTLQPDVSSAEVSALSSSYDALNSNLFVSWFVLILMSVLSVVLSFISLKLKKQKR
jgi:ABC-type multidrug transport system ATPase subunit